ncbi:MAG: flavodoxin domain-containing protein [Erysipelotrichaceae bacterium]|nr:flavodoxin domain-containing protein [Erysipelotrichaceae bacterium]MDY5252855.1 flavodoxin domain-containing protein [Erysipelotrichaceae bacterium]
MKTGIILYQSKYGSSLKYATWLKAETNFDCLNIKKTSLNHLRKYQTIILCGGIYAGNIAGITLIKKWFSHLPKQKIIILAVGAAAYDNDMIQEIKNHNLSDNLKNIPLFYARGALDMANLTIIDKIICHVMKLMLKNKANATPSYFQDIFNNSAAKNNWCQPQYLQPLLTYLDASS